MSVKKSTKYWILIDEIAAKKAKISKDPTTMNRLQLANSHLRFSALAVDELGDPELYREQTAECVNQWIRCVREKRDDIHTARPSVSWALCEALMACLSRQNFELAKELGELVPADLLRTGYERPFEASFFLATIAVLKQDSQSSGLIEALIEVSSDRYHRSHGFALKAIVQQKPLEFDTSLQTIDVGERAALRSRDAIARDLGTFSFTITGLYNLAAMQGVAERLGFESSRVPGGILLGY